MTKLIMPVEIERARKAEKRVIEVFKLDPSIFKKTTRDGQSSSARFAAWLILKYEYRMNYSTIAQIYKKNPTTVLSGIKQAIIRMHPNLLGINVWKNPVNAVDKLRKTSGKKVNK